MRRQTLWRHRSLSLLFATSVFVVGACSDELNEICGIRPEEARLSFSASTTGGPSPSVESCPAPQDYVVDVRLTNVWKGQIVGQTIVPVSAQLLLPNETSPCCLVAPGASRVTTYIVKVNDTVFVRGCFADGSRCDSQRCRVKTPEPGPGGARAEFRVVHDDRSTVASLLCSNGWEVF